VYKEGFVFVGPLTRANLQTLRRVAMTGAAVAISLSGCGASGGGPVSTAVPTVAVHAVTTHLAAKLSNGYSVAGTLYPSIPQFANTMRLRVTGPHGQVVQAPRIYLRLDMIGMRMPTVAVVAVRHGNVYVGHVTPGMFGNYWATVRMQDAGGVHRGGFVVRLGL
jgi:hypothetical protein